MTFTLFDTQALILKSSGRKRHCREMNEKAAAVIDVDPIFGLTWQQSGSLYPWSGAQAHAQTEHINGNRFSGIGIGGSSRGGLAADLALFAAG